jgi:hypothetical protein
MHGSSGGSLTGRSLDEAELQQAAARFAALERPDGLELQVETVDRRPAGRLDRDHPLLAAVRAVRAMHTPYEWIERDSIGGGIAQLERVLRRLLA